MTAFGFPVSNFIFIFVFILILRKKPQPSAEAHLSPPQCAQCAEGPCLLQAWRQSGAPHDNPAREQVSYSEGFSLKFQALKQGACKGNCLAVINQQSPSHLRYIYAPEIMTGKRANTHCGLKGLVCKPKYHHFHPCKNFNMSINVKKSTQNKHLLRFI